MTATVRYSNVKNTLGVPFTAANFINKSDGDDKQFKQIQRVLTAADIGNGVGQTHHVNGCILAVLPENYNVINISCFSHRPMTKIVDLDMVPYVPLDNGTLGEGEYPDYVYGYAKSDNTIRVIDMSDGDIAKLKEGDRITVFLTLGVPVDPSDTLNP